MRGGTLLMTPLLGADGETYAMAQGNLLVGGLGVEGGDGSSLVVNVPTVGRIPRGASVERMVETPFLNNDHMVFNLHQGDFSTATRVAEAINEFIGDPIATPLDATSVRVNALKTAPSASPLWVFWKISMSIRRGLLPKWLLIRAPALW